MSNVSRLEQWVKENLVLDSSQAETIQNVFKPIMQAAALLQVTCLDTKHGQSLVTVLSECVITNSYQSSQIRSTKIFPFNRYL